MKRLPVMEFAFIDNENEPVEAKFNRGTSMLNGLRQLQNAGSHLLSYSFSKVDVTHSMVALKIRLSENLQTL